jgi:hypothetical protein
MGNYCCCYGNDDYDEISSLENDELAEIKIPTNVQVINLEKILPAVDYSPRRDRDVGSVEHWGKIHTTFLRDLIEKNKTNEFHKMNIEHLLGQIPAGTNYRWSNVDNRITARHLFDYFHKSRNPVGRHIKLSNIGLNDYILLDAHDTYTVKQLLRWA